VISGLGRGLDFLIGLVGITAWGLAAFVVGSQLFSQTAGGLLGVGCFLSGLAMVVGGQMSDRRMRQLAAGVCPRCGAAVVSEHRHRRWQPERREWEQPSLSWECRACGFSHSERWACPSCPEAA
jgi:hypothetical protein